MNEHNHINIQWIVQPITYKYVLYHDKSTMNKGVIEKQCIISHSNVSH